LRPLGVAQSKLKVLDGFWFAAQFLCKNIDQARCVPSVHSAACGRVGGLASSQPSSESACLQCSNIMHGNTGKKVDARDKYAVWITLGLGLGLGLGLELGLGCMDHAYAGFNRSHIVNPNTILE
jgi:hypothetical protein